MYIIYTKKGLEIERTDSFQKAQMWIALGKGYYYTHKLKRGKYLKHIKNK